AEEKVGILDAGRDLVARDRRPAGALPGIERGSDEGHVIDEVLRARDRGELSEHGHDERQDPDAGQCSKRETGGEEADRDVLCGGPTDGPRGGELRHAGYAPLGSSIPAKAGLEGSVPCTRPRSRRARLATVSSARPPGRRSAEMASRTAVNSEPSVAPATSSKATLPNASVGHSALTANPI